MAKAYYRLEDDVDLEGRWFLNGLRDSHGTRLDTRDFTYGVPVEVGPPLRASLWNDKTIVETRPPLTMALRRAGTPLDFTFADFDMPVVASRIAGILAEVASSGIQRMPVCVESHGGNFEIINVVERVGCIDTEKSNIMWWTEADRRPDKIGKPRMITALRIDPTRAGERNIFRLEGWEIALIVSDLVKDTLEEAKVSGIAFSPV
jgi:hypothetical protein